MKYLKIMLLLFCPLIFKGQNLVPNYSFEDTARRINTPLHPVKDWVAATNEGWNYYTPVHNLQYPEWGVPANSGGFQVAKTGSAYVGINLYNLWSVNRNPRREYMQVKLKRVLKFDSTYCFQLFMSLADSIQFASKNMLGVYFSANAIGANNTNYLPYTPQITLSPNTFITDRQNWVEVNMQYKALGGEEYITIGNFNDTNYIDTTFVPGGGDQYWMEASYYYIDDVWLSHCDSLPDSLIGIKTHSLQSKLSVYPSPFVHDFIIRSKQNQTLQFSLYNSLGQQIDFRLQKQGSNYLIQPKDIPKGMYWLQVSDGKEQASFKMVKE
ncbi:MAG: T9SS type A sorting domain-containing protein [Flavobacteriales bacterium]|nr:T9SS type A sorting domain-containing protein [Flavobacteriales bacterium]